MKRTLLDLILHKTLGRLGEEDHLIVGAIICSVSFYFLSQDGRLNLFGGGRVPRLVIGFCGFIVFRMFTSHLRDNLAHTSQHVLAALCVGLWAAFSIAEQHALVQDGTSSIVVSVTFLILGAIMFDHVGHFEVENHGHRMIALSLLAGGAVAARMAIYPFTSWTYRVFWFLFGIIGIIFIGIGLWRGHDLTWISGNDHRDIMILNSWVSFATLLLLVATILRWSRRTRNPHSSHDHVSRSDAQETSTHIPGLANMPYKESANEFLPMLSLYRAVSVWMVISYHLVMMHMGSPEDKNAVRAGRAFAMPMLFTVSGYCHKNSFARTKQLATAFCIGFSLNAISYFVFPVKFFWVHPPKGASPLVDKLLEILFFCVAQNWYILIIWFFGIFNEYWRLLNPILITATVIMGAIYGSGMHFHIFGLALTQTICFVSVEVLEGIGNRAENNLCRNAVPWMLWLCPSLGHVLFGGGGPGWEMMIWAWCFTCGRKLKHPSRLQHLRTQVWSMAPFYTMIFVWFASNVQLIPLPSNSKISSFMGRYDFAIGRVVMLSVSMATALDSDKIMNSSMIAWVRWFDMVMLLSYLSQVFFLMAVYNMVAWSNIEHFFPSVGVVAWGLIVVCAGLLHVTSRCGSKMKSVLRWHAEEEEEEEEEEEKEEVAYETVNQRPDVIGLADPPEELPLDAQGAAAVV